MSTPAGWYPDPYDPSQQRWWNGLVWGDQTQATLPPMPAPYASTPQYVAPAPYVSYQDVASPTALARLPTVSPFGRLGAYLLDVLLLVVTLFIGWLIWAGTLADKGQTPAKKILGHRVVMDYTGQPASFARMLFLRGILGGMVANLIIPVTLGIVLLLPFVDKQNRNFWDHLSSTRVVQDPS